jgi:hypothetical protein
MNLATLRPILSPLIGAAICFAVSPRPNASVQTKFADRLLAKAVSTADEKYAGRIEIFIEHWSPDEAVDRLATAFKEGPDHLLPALETNRRQVGVLMVPGVQGVGPRVRSPWPRDLLFARQVETPNGRQIILAGDRHLGIGELPRWGVSSNQEFTLVDIRIGKDGTGVGKIASEKDVEYNPVTKTFEVKNYESQAVRLVDVASEKH